MQDLYHQQYDEVPGLFDNESATKDLPEGSEVSTWGDTFQFHKCEFPVIGTLHPPNPKPTTLNLNPKPTTLNPKLLNPKPTTLNPKGPQDPSGCFLLEWPTQRGLHMASFSPYPSYSTSCHVDCVVD